MKVLRVHAKGISEGREGTWIGEQTFKFKSDKYDWHVDQGGTLHITKPGDIMDPCIASFSKGHWYSVTWEEVPEEKVDV